MARRPCTLRWKDKNPLFYNIVAHSIFACFNFTHCRFGIGIIITDGRTFGALTSLPSSPNHFAFNLYPNHVILDFFAYHFSCCFVNVNFLCFHFLFPNIFDAFSKSSVNTSTYTAFNLLWAYKLTLYVCMDVVDVGVYF